MRFVQNLGAAIAIVIVLSGLYHLIPARRLAAKKPTVAVFPKYWINVEDLDAFKLALAEEGFEQTSTGDYVRGKYFGDLFANWVKMKVSLSSDNKQAQIGSGFMVIAFDTGDLWKLCKRLEAS